MDYVKAFLVGRVMVTLVVTGTILGCLGVYEPFSKWAGAGVSVPLLGFGNTLWKDVKEGMPRYLSQR